MAYQAEISRQSPTLILFIVDQSTSMRLRLTEGPSKAGFLADVINKTIYTLITNCTKADGVRDYFFVGVLGYSGSDARSLLGNLPIIASANELANSPLRIEERSKTVIGAHDEPIKQSIKFPVWLDPISAGKTSMCSGLALGLQLVRKWCNEHPNSYPPTLLHVTDGHPTDGDPEPIASEIKAQGTEDGCALLYNLHVDEGGVLPVLFPHQEGVLKDKYAKKLFRMSSELPQSISARASALRYKISPGSRGFIFNAGLGPIIDFFDLGTRAHSIADR